MTNLFRCSAFYRYNGLKEGLFPNIPLPTFTTLSAQGLKERAAIYLAPAKKLAPLPLNL